MFGPEHRYRIDDWKLCNILDWLTSKSEREGELIKVDYLANMPNYVEREER